MRIGIDGRKIADYGIGTYIRGLLHGLDALGGEETFVVLAPAAARPLIPERFEHVELDTKHYSLRELVKVGLAAERARVDLLHLPHYVLPLTHCPTVVTLHDLIHLHQRQRNPLARPYARLMIARAVGNADRVLTVSEAVRDDILATFQCAAEKVVVTPNGIDDLFRVAQPNAQPERYFLYAGNDKPHKRVGELVQAFGALHGEMSDLSLVLVGASFERFQSVPGVITAGFVEQKELAALYRNALALVQPSAEEGFGLPAAEAMASGTAVITSTAAALVEITSDAALHADDLVDAMRRVASDDALRRALASRGVARAAQFTWRRCAQLTLDAYRSVLL